MEDPNLIACLYPYKESSYARRTIGSPENSSGHIPALLQKEEPLLGRQSRQSTAPLEENKNEPPAYLYEDGLQLTFSHGPKGDKGFALGKDRHKCDIVLLNVKDSISGCHCYLTFDKQNRLILRDDSFNGTIVTYDGEGGERRRNFTWILGGDKVPDKKIKNIVIEFHRHLKFQIVIPKHKTHLDQYIANVERFRAEAAAHNELPFGRLGMDSAKSTAAHSEAHTPNQGRILLKQRTLGKGSYAVVTHFWDVSTGIEYACKMPRKKSFDRETWEKEINMMKPIRHNHIVQLRDSDETPLPCLYLEYLPFGNLEHQDRKRHISYEETLTILHQSLSALEYLHGQETPIVHRDIKPENILVLTRDPLHIKLADFGLAKAGDSLKTICGTGTYCPPEIAKYFGLSKSAPKDKYTEAVDIWSLGVVILRFALPGLPHPGSGVGIDWCDKIIDEVNDYDGDLIDFLSTAMLVMRPESRYSAQICLDRVEVLFIPSRDGSLTPTPASYTEECETTAVGYHAEERLAEEQPTSSGDTDSHLRSSEIRRYIKPNAPPPSAETRKRLTRPSMSPTRRSSKRRAKKASSSNCPQHELSEPALDLFNEGWLQDSKCVGSSVAALGREDPTLSILKPVRQPGEYLETLIQIWDPPGDATCRSKEDERSRQEVSINSGSDRRHLKRQCARRPSTLPSNSQPTHTTSKMISLTALSDRESPSLSTGLHRNSSRFTEWQGSYLRPFGLSEVLEVHPTSARLAHLRHCEDDQSPPLPKAVANNQPSGSFQGATIGSTAQLTRVPHGPSRNGDGLMNTGAADHVSRTNNVSSHLDRHIGAHLKLATKGVPFNSHTPMPRQVSGPTQQPTERRFLVLSTLYGPIHILAEGSTLLVNATNIANIYGYNRILNFRGTPSPEKVVTASDSQLRGNYYTIESALQYCDVLNGQNDANQCSALKGMLQRAIENHRSRQKLLPEKHFNSTRPRCKRCARLHTACNRELPCYRCIHAHEDCIYT